MAPRFAVHARRVGALIVGDVSRGSRIALVHFCTLLYSSPMSETMTVDEAAALLGVGRVTVLRYCRSGKLEAKKVSNRWRILRAAAVGLRRSWRVGT